MSWVTLLQLWQ
ncbi:unnamed protein product, partial [Allacma fusca]